jgi:coenzyme F420-dependent glucose-6-phosphate dehydrogenase
VAQAFATLACLCPGRVFLGVGTGEALNEVPCGFAWPSTHKERLERLREAIIMIRLLWSKPFVSFRGKYYKLSKANLYDKPPVPIPIHIASTGVKGAELAGELADAFMTLLPADPSQITETLFPVIARGARKCGRKFEEIEKSLNLSIGFYRDDYEKALDSLMRWRGTLLPVFFDLGVYDPRYIEMHGNRVGRETVEKLNIIATSEEEITKSVEKYIKIGFTHVSVGATGDLGGFMQTMQEKVMPYIRETYKEIGGSPLPYKSTITSGNLQDLATRYNLTIRTAS